MLFIKIFVIILLKKKEKKNVNMENLNCLNCGAPIEPFNHKCKYCGTSYFDLTSMDINGNKPFYLKIKIDNKIITQLVKVSSNSITLKQSNIYVEADKNMSYKYLNSQSLFINVEFQAVPDSAGCLCKMYIEDNN